MATGIATPARSSAPDHDAPGLREIARRHGRFYGAAAGDRVLAEDPAFARAFAKQCGLLVPEGEAKWRVTQPARGRFDFSALDRLRAFARAEGMQFRGHCLVWHLGVPPWLEPAVRSGTPEEAEALLESHIAAVVGHARGAQSWDVVNEAIDVSAPGPDHLRRGPWLDALGPDYIDRAFRAARRSDPDTKLVYNETGTEHADARSRTKRAAVLRLLGGLKARGVPVDALGLQAHLFAGNPIDPGEMRDYVRAAAALGLDVYVTELDVIDKALPRDPAVRDRAVADIVTVFLDAVLAEPALKGVITWGLSNRYSWLNDAAAAPFARRADMAPSRGLPLDAELDPTPMWRALAAALGKP